MSSPKISIIIPVYNIEKYIAKCLDSILNQTFDDYELIIVDDCSTDDTMKIVESYKPKFENKLIITKTKENSGGCSVPRNVGLPLATGEYVFFVDGDDYLKNYALEVLHNNLNEYHPDIIYTTYYYYETLDGTTERVGEYKGQIMKLVKTEELLKNNVFLYPMVWLKLVKRDILINNNIEFKNYAGQDYPWTIEILYFSKNVMFLPTALYYYRHNKSSIVHSFKKRDPTGLYPWIEQILKTYKEMTDSKDKIKIYQNPVFCTHCINHRYISYLARALNKFKVHQNKDICDIIYSFIIKDKSLIYSLIGLCLDTLESQRSLLRALEEIHRKQEQERRNQVNDQSR